LTLTFCYFEELGFVLVLREHWKNFNYRISANYQLFCFIDKAYKVILCLIVESGWTIIQFDRMIKIDMTL